MIKEFNCISKFADAFYKGAWGCFSCFCSVETSTSKNNYLISLIVTGFAKSSCPYFSISIILIVFYRRV